MGLGLLWALGDLDAAGLAATACLDLCLDDYDWGTESCRGRFGLGGSGCRNASQYRNTMRFEHISVLGTRTDPQLPPCDVCGGTDQLHGQETRFGHAARQTNRSLSVAAGLDAK